MREGTNILWQVQRNKNLRAQTIARKISILGGRDWVI